jgi:hypothetical protein
MILFIQQRNAPSPLLNMKLIPTRITCMPHGTELFSSTLIAPSLQRVFCIEQRLAVLPLFRNHPTHVCSLSYLDLHAGAPADHVIGVPGRVLDSIF